MSDYTLLEEAGRTIDAASRTRQSTIPHINGRARKNPALTPGISKGRMIMLAREAAKRNINLRFMPKGMSRHNRNSSYVRSIPEPEVPIPLDERKDRREKAMFWHLDVYFASCSQKHPGTKLVKVDACEEEQKISSILKGATGALKKGRKRRRPDAITCTSKANDGYARYLDANPEDLEVFLRNEHVLSTGNLGSPLISVRATARKDEFDISRYAPVENDQTLREVLVGRSVVEFPVLHVAFRNSREAKELAKATSGIFEKPDDSSDSDSSYSESDSEQERDEHTSSQVPGSPTSDLREADNEKQASAAQIENPRVESNTEVQKDGEPLPKRRKIEISSDESSFHTAEVDNAAGSSAEVKGKENSSRTGEHALEKVKPTQPFPGSNGILPSIEERENELGKLETPPLKLVKDKKSEPLAKLIPQKGQSDDKQDSAGVASPVNESTSLDTASRRGSGLHFDHPFMKESVKAILETRIPRKPKVENKANCPSGSGKRSAKLTATG